MTHPPAPATDASLIISVVVCTHNRSMYLRRALEGLRRQTCDRARYEVIVVDNCSTDDTKTAVGEVSGSGIRVRYIFESRLGLSVARNTGWRQASGRYVAFLDDDAVPDSKWLDSIVQAFETVVPRPGAVGGRIDPIWEAPRPRWISDRVALGLTIIDWSDTAGFLREGQFLAGANVAYPRELLERTGGFDSSLGRTGTNLISCEEILLNEKVERLGHGLYYQPEASVGHHIQERRLTKQWHLDRQYWNGLSMATVRRMLDRPPLAKRVLAAGVAMGGAGFALVKLALTPARREAEWFDLRCRINGNLGYCRGLMSRGTTNT